MNEGSAFTFDLETTGTDPNQCTPCQICLIHSSGAGERRILMNTYVRPAEAIPPATTAVHGITDQMAAGGPDYIMAAWQAQLLCQKIRPDYLIGFNSISFDEPIIDRCLGGRVFEGTQHLDVLNIAYRFFPTLDSHKLGALYEHFMGKPLVGAHDASVDVIGTLDLLEAILRTVGMTMSQMAEEMKTAKVYSHMPIGKHKGLTPDQVPQGWAKWMKKNATDMRPDLQATVDHIIDGP